MIFNYFNCSCDSKFCWFCQVRKFGLPVCECYWYFRYRSYWSFDFFKVGSIMQTHVLYLHVQNLLLPLMLYFFLQINLHHLFINAVTKIFLSTLEANILNFQRNKFRTIKNSLQYNYLLLRLLSSHKSKAKRHKKNVSRVIRIINFISAVPRNMTCLQKLSIPFSRYFLNFFALILIWDKFTNHLARNECA